MKFSRTNSIEMSEGGLFLNGEVYPNVADSSRNGAGENDAM